MEIYVRNVFGVPFFAPSRRERLRTVCHEILAYTPDIVLLQEVFLPQDVALIRKILSKKYAIIRKQSNFFDLGGGLMALVAHGIPYDAEYVLFANSGLVTGLSVSDKIARKGFQILRFGDYTILHTHMTCPYDASCTPQMTQLLQSQLDDISQCIQSISGPICVCGDLNLEPETALLKKFIHTNQLQDNSAHIAKTYLGNFYRPKCFFRNSTKSQKIDYVLSRGFGNKKIQVHASDDKSFISDHTFLYIQIG